MTTNSVTQRLLEAAAEIWEGYDVHPFICGLADGSLAVEKFQYYLIQDYLYLFEYAKVFAMGVVKAQEPEIMSMFAGYVHQILDEEMGIHKGYMQRMGITAEHAVPALQNLSYTAYMRSIAMEEGVAEIIAAILSCAISYEQIAKRMLKKNPVAAFHPLYGEWIRSYAGEAYAEGNQLLCEKLEQLTTGMTEKQIQRLCEIFVTCSRYEALFWDMAWNRC